LFQGQSENHQVDEGEQEREANQSSDDHSSVDGDRDVCQQIAQKNRANDDIENR
jgi:hypothetical protein